MVAKFLDNNNQECMVIIGTITENSKWYNKVAVRTWDGVKTVDIQVPMNGTKNILDLAIRIHNEILEMG